MPEQTMTLRNAAQSLAHAKNPKAREIQSSKLLNLLKSGELKAGFYILGGSMWVEIPLAHWETVGADKFRIGRSRDDPKSGTYKLSLSNFSPEVAKVVSKQLDENDKSLDRHTSSKIGILAAVVEAAAKSYEVTVKSKEFTEYLHSQGLEEPLAAPKGGRYQKEGWRDVSSYMAAYMAAQQRDRPEDHFTAENSAEEIFQLAKGANVADLPSSAGIKEQVAKAMKLLTTAEFNLNRGSPLARQLSEAEEGDRGHLRTQS
jgi:hypothetical protein